MFNAKTEEEFFGEDYNFDNTVIKDKSAIDAFIKEMSEEGDFYGVREMICDGMQAKHHTAYKKHEDMDDFYRIADIIVRSDGTAICAFTGDADYSEASRFVLGDM